MIYILDTSSIIVCGHYFPSRFPTFWADFDALVQSGRLLSVREVRRELDTKASREHLRTWVNHNRAIFLLPAPEETTFVAQIFSIPHFQQLVGKKQRLSGRPVADPFVVASARCREACVVTEEKIRPGAAKIPNVCSRFTIDCISLEQLMEREGLSY